MVTETEKKIYLRLKEMRKESGVTYYALKKVAGIPQHALKAIESGSRSCTLTTILKLLEQYKRTPSELFNGIE